MTRPARFGRAAGVLLWPALAAIALASPGCGTQPQPRSAPVPPQALTGRPTVLMLPLSNLSGRIEQGDLVSRVFFAELPRSWNCDVVDYGEAQRLADDLRLRDTASPTSAQVRALRDSTGAAYLLIGTVLEAGSVRSPEGDMPSVGVALRLVDTATLRPVWADSQFLTGQDRETVFGWGRETSLSRLISRLASLMFQSFRAGPASEGSASADSAPGGSR